MPPTFNVILRSARRARLEGRKAPVQRPPTDPLDRAAGAAMTCATTARGCVAHDLSEMRRALVFPGQGSQMPGMGKELAEAFPAARLLFEEVDDALSQHLSRLMFEGSESELI